MENIDSALKDKYSATMQITEKVADCHEVDIKSAQTLAPNYNEVLQVQEFFEAVHSYVS